MIKLQFYLTVFGGVAPALINLLSVLLAVASSAPVGTGEALMMLALFYVAIDVGNFGASRLVLISDFSANLHALRLLDYVSGLISSISFYLISVAVVDFGFVNLDCSLVLLSVFPFLYCFSHSALGILRVNSSNGVVALVLVLCSLIRLTVTYFHVIGYFSAENFLLGLFLVEGLQGVLFFVCVKLGSSTGSIAAYDSSVMQVILRNKKMVNASWVSNILSGLVKHSDVFLIGVLAGPSSVVLYRPIKSAVNLVFNVASSLSVVYVSGAGFVSVRALVLGRVFLFCLGAFVAFVFLFSFLVDAYWYLFFSDVVFENAFLVVLVSGFIFIFVFLNRFLYSMLVRSDASSVMVFSSFIDVSILYLFFFSLVPGFGVLGAVLSILMSSMFVFLYGIFHLNKRFGLKGT